MIIIRVPFRLPIGGGGSDLPAYYSQFGGQLVTASINRYMFVNINRPATNDKIKLYYAYTEIVNSISEIQHNIIRESLKLHGIDKEIEIGSMADLEAGTGMGSSSAFTVGLLAGLNALNRKFISPKELAEQACKVEIELVGKPIGKQDQYATACGGINELVIDFEGNVTVNPLSLSKDTLYELENRLLMFYTGTRRDANEILSEQSQKISNDEGVVQGMHDIKKLGTEIKDALLEGNIDLFGRLLNFHWEIKKMISDKMSSPLIDHYYKMARQNGALGGKIMGAGGGGLFLFCVKAGARNVLKRTLEREGLKQMDFRFEFEGAKIIANI